MNAPLPKKAIFVIDDSPAVTQSFVAVLRYAGFHATGEVSAARGLETARLQRPDILLCDVQLDGTRGVELSLELLKSLPECRVILISGDRNSPKILADARERGHDFEVLRKPIMPQELLALLGSA